jgi:hypothetical protein
MQAALRIIYFVGRDDGRDPPPGAWAGGFSPAESEDLPYRVEVWDESGEHPEMLVAVSISASLAYAAYYAAAREFFGRDITIRHKGETIAHWRTRQN